MSNSADNQVFSNLEVVRAAERLVKTQGVGAAVYVDMKIKEMEDMDDKENQIYWQAILKEAEKLLYDD